MNRDTKQEPRVGRSWLQRMRQLVRESDEQVRDSLERPTHSRRSALAALVGMPAAAAAVVAVGGTGHAQNQGQGQGNRNQFADEFQQITAHEIAHVQFLKEALGQDARPAPTFQGLVQRDYPTFVRVAQSLENTGTGAYLGAVPAIFDPDVLASSGSIALIEGRHAGWLNAAVFDDPITGSALNPLQDRAFEDPLTPAQVGALAGPFIKDLNGGPPLDYSTVPSEENDTRILNFALALELLEAQFYLLNVPRFFGRGQGQNRNRNRNDD